MTRFDAAAARAFDRQAADVLVAIYLMGSQARGERPLAVCTADTDVCAVVTMGLPYERLCGVVEAGLSWTGRLEVCPRTVDQLRRSTKFTFDLCASSACLYLREGGSDPRNVVPRPLTIPEGDVSRLLFAAVERSSAAVHALHADDAGLCAAATAAEKALVRLGEYSALRAGCYPAQLRTRVGLLTERFPDLGPDLAPLACLRIAVSPRRGDDVAAVAAAVCAVHREVTEYLRVDTMDLLRGARSMADREHWEFAEELLRAFLDFGRVLGYHRSAVSGPDGAAFADAYWRLVVAGDGLRFKPPVLTTEGYHVFK